MKKIILIAIIFLPACCEAGWGMPPRGNIGFYFPPVYYQRPPVQPYGYYPVAERPQETVRGNYSVYYIQNNIQNNYYANGKKRTETKTTIEKKFMKDAEELYRDVYSERR